MSIFIDTLNGQKTSPTPVWLNLNALKLPDFINIISFSNEVVATLKLAAKVLSPILIS